MRRREGFLLISLIFFCDLNLECAVSVDRNGAGPSGAEDPTVTRIMNSVTAKMVNFKDKQVFIFASSHLAILYSNLKPGRVVVASDVKVILTVLPIPTNS